jgi:hypothetical protein
MYDANKECGKGSDASSDSRHIVNLELRCNIFGALSDLQYLSSVDNEELFPCGKYSHPPSSS